MQAAANGGTRGREQDAHPRLRHHSESCAQNRSGRNNCRRFFVLSPSSPLRRVSGRLCAVPTSQDLSRNAKRASLDMLQAEWLCGWLAGGPVCGTHPADEHSCSSCASVACLLPVSSPRWLGVGHAPAASPLGVSATCAARCRVVVHCILRASIPVVSLCRSAAAACACILADQLSQRPHCCAGSFQLLPGSRVGLEPTRRDSPLTSRHADSQEEPQGGVQVSVPGCVPSPPPP